MKHNTVGQRIHEVRKSLKITSDALAEMCGLSTGSYVRQIERGAKLPSVPSLLSICKALNVSPDYLLGGELEKIGLLPVEKSVCDNISRLSPYQIACVEALVNKFIELDNMDAEDK